MPNSGSGTGTPITSSMPPGGVYSIYEEPDALTNCAVPLSRYAQIIAYDEAAFWGVVYENQHRLACADLWTAWQRLSVAQALAEAQAMIEQEIGYPLCPIWVVGQLADEPNGDARWVDVQKYTVRQATRYSHILAPGVRATATIQAGAPVNYAADPAVVGPVAITFNDASEIKVYYPGSNREITPSKVAINGGQLTIEIPRVRLVRVDLWDNDQAGIQYDELENFVETVDLARIYNDPSTNAVLVRPHCQNNHCAGGCQECTQTACMYVRDARVGVVDVTPATWDAGTQTWKQTTGCGGPWAMVRLYYRCGIQMLDLRAEKAIVRLAHSLMPEAPCHCDQTKHLWQADQKAPDLLTRERLNCPWGLSQGAWVAWRFAQTLKAGTISLF